MMARSMSVSSPDRLRSTIDAMAATGCDELILVPADSDLALLDRISDVVC